MKQRIAKTFERSRIPLYLQVASAIRRRIDEGQWRPGQKIPTLEEFETEFQVARVTVRQAIDILEQEGLVRRQQGKGTFVAGTIKDKRWLTLATQMSQMVESIQDNVPHFIPVKDPPALPRLLEGDGRPADDYVYLRSVQYRDGEPFCVVSTHLSRSLYKRAPSAFLSHTSLATLASFEDIEIVRAHQTLVIGTADPEIADFLHVPLNAPTAESHCAVTDDKGGAIYVAEIVYRGDCISLDIDLLADVKAKHKK